MHVVRGDNVNTVWIDGLWRLKTNGYGESTRNGKAIVLDSPMTSIYEKPWERVLFHPERNANPFFHLMEALWMIAGSNRVEFLEQFNPRMREFAEQDGVIHGAYGYRWRWMFKTDQLSAAVMALRKNPESRQVVLAMWNPIHDLLAQKKDIPCNTHIYFRGREGVLEMTVCCRSNDAVWGAYGANVVHFSILHELIANATGLQQGRMYQISNNFHIYERHWKFLEKPLVLGNHYAKPYAGERPKLTIPLCTVYEDWTEFREDCVELINGHPNSFHTKFFKLVVAPALEVWRYHKREEYDFARTAMHQMSECDWKIAMQEWIQRQEEKTNASE
jgi:thymidylate synthase